MMGLGLICMNQHMCDNRRVGNGYVVIVKRFHNTAIVGVVVTMILGFIVEIIPLVTLQEKL